MGAAISFLIVEIIELATEATLTVAEVTANILSEISSSVIDGIIDSVETASDAFDSLGSSTLQDAYNAASNAATMPFVMRWRI